MKEIFDTNEFRCSRFFELNDPMEGVFYASGIASEARRTIDRVYRLKQSYRICSFSSIGGFRRPQMWGYYAGGFYGLAIEIDVPREQVRGIDYVKDLSKVQWSTDNIENILRTKLTCWKHESEFRYLNILQRDTAEIGRITAVYFGNPYANTSNYQTIRSNSPKLKEYIARRDELISKYLNPCGIRWDNVSIVGGEVKVGQP